MPNMSRKNTAGNIIRRPSLPGFEAAVLRSRSSRENSRSRSAASFFLSAARVLSCPVSERSFELLSAASSLHLNAHILRKDATLSRRAPSP